MPSPRLAVIAGELESLAEQLADLALECLREALDAVESDPEGGQPDAAKVAEEKRITRARRSVERAAWILRTAGGNRETRE